MTTKSRIAIIGTGISGLTCGHLLAEQYDVQVFEANDYIGGHTATKQVNIKDKSYNIDTGFIVFNDWTYPNFIKLMDKLGVQRQKTEMSFSVHNLESGLQYNGNNLNSLFAQRRNLFSLKFHRLIRDILRFNKLCKQVLSEGTDTSTITLSEFINQHRFSDSFSQNYILPMCAAIWSASLEAAGQFPLAFFLKFFNNHGLLNVNDRPQWYTLIGGSHSYIGPMTANFKDKIKLSSAVQKVSKTEDGISIQANNENYLFDHVIFACHSDQALKMIDLDSLPSVNANNIQQVLGAIPYAMNEVVLHTDSQLMPPKKLAWASWNYRIKGSKEEAQAPATVSYNMNILQRIADDESFVVTLNDTDSIAPHKILGKYYYAHPQFSVDMVNAQEQRGLICGSDNFHYCGAYWYNGFHEDGVRSALDVCKRFGVNL